MPTHEGVAARIVEFAADPWLAHTFLFPHRHSNLSSEAHRELVADIHDREPRRSIEGFRGFGKTTYLEEAAIIKALLRKFKNLVLVGATYGLACERLEAIKLELVQNEAIILLFGNLKGPVWREDKIVLTTGICLQARGRDQAMTGTKHYESRPDAAMVDDVENPEEIRTDDHRKHTWNWWITTFLPSLAHPLKSWIRVLGTRRGKGSLPERLEDDHWPVSKFPVEFRSVSGHRQPTWAAQFELDDIDQIKRTYRGNMDVYNQEYMCEAFAEAHRPFTQAMMKVEPRVRTWQAVFAMYDPARTTYKTSATTGKAVWSWIGNKLVFWDLDAQMWLPDAIINDIMETALEWSPAWIGVEEDGLNEFILQPLRHEQTRRRLTFPVRAIRAPRSKLDFIRGLQPFFAAGEVEFARHFSDDVLGQFLSFPTGRIDAPNAAAYALLMRPGQLIYENFSDEHIAEDIGPLPNRPLYLAANANGSLVTGVLCQLADGQLRILADFVREGDPAEVAVDIHMEAALVGDTTRSVTERVPATSLSDMLKVPEHRVTLARMPISWALPPNHAERFRNVGLAQAVRAIPAPVSFGASAELGRDDIRGRLDQVVRGAPALVVSDQARWTLNAFAGGYGRAVTRGGIIADHAEEGVYRLLMEGLESFAGITGRASVTADEDDEGRNYSYNRAGQRYLSAMPARR